MNPIEEAIRILGGDGKTARLFNPKLTPKAVRKWRIAGKLPRTEATGETTYALQMAAADPRINAHKLIATTLHKKSPQKGRS